MSVPLDARIVVLFGNAEDVEPTDATLCEGAGLASSTRDWFQPDGAGLHPPSCQCCLPRNSAGLALTRLMLARGRGTGLFFSRVIAVGTTHAGRASITVALARDPVVSVFYRAGGR